MKRSMTIDTFRETGGGSARIVQGQHVLYCNRMWTVLVYDTGRNLIQLED